MREGVSHTWPERSGLPPPAGTDLGAQAADEFGLRRAVQEVPDAASLRREVSLLGKREAKDRAAAVSRHSMLAPSHSVLATITEARGVGSSESSQARVTA
jgi:hypothetical protein